jgi:hypothetical protein
MTVNNDSEKGPVLLLAVLFFLPIPNVQRVGKMGKMGEGAA